MILIRPLFRHYLAKKFIKKNLLPHSKIIDIGCGQGDFDFWLAKRDYEIECFEFSDEAVREFKKTQSKKNLPNIKLRETDFFQYPENPLADLIISFEVLEHMENDLGILQKINEWLKKNSHLILSVPAHKKMWGYNDDLTGHKRRYEKKELRKLLEQAGFSTIKIYSPGFPWLNILQIIRNFYLKKTHPLIKEGDENKTKKSGVMIKSFPHFLRIIFNPITLYPFILISNLFNNFDLSEGYFVTAKKI